MLGLWTLDRSGVPIDYNSVVKAANWLGRVTRHFGGWPYQGNDGGGGRLLAQTE